MCAPALTTVAGGFLDNQVNNGRIMREVGRGFDSVEKGVRNYYRGVESSVRGFGRTYESGVRSAARSVETSARKIGRQARRNYSLSRYDDLAKNVKSAFEKPEIPELPAPTPPPPAPVPGAQGIKKSPKKFGSKVKGVSQFKFPISAGANLPGS